MKKRTRSVAQGLKARATSLSIAVSQQSHPAAAQAHPAESNSPGEESSPTPSSSSSGSGSFTGGRSGWGSSSRLNKTTTNSSDIIEEEDAGTGGSDVSGATAADRAGGRPAGGSNSIDSAGSIQSSTPDPSAAASAASAGMGDTSELRCYEPFPALIADNYNCEDWRPVAITPSTVRMMKESLMGQLGTHEGQDFYHGDLQREEVSSFFRRHGNQAGLCVVRDSSRAPGSYTLSVSDGRACVNYCIEFTLSNTGEGSYTLSGKSRFSSIAEIILFLNEHGSNFPAQPTQFIPRLPEKVKCMLFREHFMGGAPKVQSVFGTEQ